jgi:type IV pilus assembly protein PilW
MKYPKPNSFPYHSTKTMTGASLIEIMIALTAGVFVIAGIGYAYIGTKQSFRGQDVLARMQEGARAAFELLEKDIRMAGFQGCRSNSAASSHSTTDINVLTQATDWDKNLVGPGGISIQGYENTNQKTVAISATQNHDAAFPTDFNGNAVTGVTGNVSQGDAITILHADTAQEYIVSADNNGSSLMTLAVNHNLPQGQILLVTDCTRTAEFMNTQPCTLTNGSCGDALIQYGRSSTVTTTQLGTPLGTPYNFAKGSRVFPLSATTYYVGTNGNGEPALFRAINTTTTQELVEGVQDMQLSYALDTTGDGQVDSYAAANNITAAQWSANSPFVILGVRISLLMVSRSNEPGINVTPQPYQLDKNGNGVTTDSGEAITTTSNPVALGANDLLLRKVFTTTIALKDRL